jgi:ATP-binding cassette, subfamily C (CFTR/MRP), member 1
MPKMDKEMSGPSFLSRIFFWWINKLMFMGYKNTLDFNDLVPLDSPLDIKNLTKEFSAKDVPSQLREIKNLDNTTAQNRKITKILFYKLVKSVWPLFVVTGILRILTIILLFVNPILLKMLIGFVSQEQNTNLSIGYTLSISILISSLITTLVRNYSEHLILVMSYQVLSCLSSVIYKKVDKILF